MILILLVALMGPTVALNQENTMSKADPCYRTIAAIKGAIEQTVQQFASARMISMPTVEDFLITRLPKSVPPKCVSFVGHSLTIGAVKIAPNGIVVEYQANSFQLGFTIENSGSFSGIYVKAK